MKNVRIYTDGSCNWKTQLGGWAAVLIYKNVRKVVSGCEEKTTNNRMELQGAISGLKSLKYPCIVDLYTDSEYIIKILHSKRHQFEKNDDLCQEFRDAARKHNFAIHWVKAHNGDKFNEMADEAARKEMQGLSKVLRESKHHKTRWHYHK